MSAPADPRPIILNGCFICGGELREIPRSDYSRCATCAHEALTGSTRQRLIVNDDLDQPPALDVRDSFQRRVVREVTREARLLIDIGCGSGRFLHFNKDAFEAHLGVEITEASVNFARSYWGLTVEKRLPALSQPPSLVTFWHSLEHIPPAEAISILKQLRSNSSPRTRIVVCVPNAGSLQAALFGRSWTYYDAPNHLHQFSPGSLERLLAKCGFIKDLEFFSFIYVFAGHLLSSINLITPGHNYFYYRKKRGNRSKYGALATAALDAFCCTAAVSLAIPALLLTLAEAFAPRRQAVITYSFKPDSEI